jgi:hypothetical protein
MVIERISPEMFQLHGAGADFSLLRNSLNEVCHGLQIDDFERWIGASCEQAAHLLQAMPTGPGPHWGEPGFGFDALREDWIRAEISAANFRVLRAALYETCNRIALYEFHTRLGREFEDALVLLRVMAAHLGLPRYG